MSSSLPDSSSRNRSNSGEDPELSEHDRKRPRLSDGTSDAESNLADFQSSVESVSPSSLAAPSPAPPLPSRKSELNMSTPSPTSKVTINTRPLSSQSVNQIPMNSIAGDASHATQSTEPVPSQPDGSTISDAISISSSPTASPEIEVAEVEYQDHDPSQTRWSRLGTDNKPFIRPSHVHDTFPLAYQCEPGEARMAVDVICKALGESTADSHEVFNQTKDWFSDFAVRCSSLTDDIVNEERDFWAKAHLLINSILKRELKAPTLWSDSDFIRFFNAYGDVTKLVIQYDTRRILELVDAAPTSPVDVSIMSWHWLQSAAGIITSRPQSPELSQHYNNVDVSSIRRAFIDHVMDPTGIDLMSSVVDLVEAIGTALPKYPKLCKQLNPLFNSLDHLVRLFPTMSFESFPHAHTVKAITERIIRLFDDILQTAIKKQQTWLTIENATEVVEQLNKSMKTLACEVDSVALELIKAAKIDLLEEDLSDREFTMFYAWKFTTLNRFIKHGRMELRVAGVEQISRDLVDVYYARIQNEPNGSDDALVRFLVRFLRGNDMTRYIVSVDSHPNLAERASNLVGFLSVARQYTKADTDSIWDVIEHGQDPRMIAAAFRLLHGCFVTFAMNDFHYLCEKVLGLPFQKLDDKTLHFTIQVLQNIRQKSHTLMLNFEGRYDPIVRRLCFWLLREANTPQRCASEFADLARRDVLNMLIHFIHPARVLADQVAISEEEQSELMAHIRRDIDLHGDYACGAVLLLNEILALHLGPSMISSLVDQCACPEVVVSNVAALSEQEKRQSTMSPEALHIQFESRLVCLFNLVRLVPDRFDRDIIRSIWDSVLVATHLPEPVRTSAWGHLTMLMRQIKVQNSALSMILMDFWPTIRPGSLNKPALDFAKQGVVYESYLSGQNVVVTENVIVIPGIERVWTLMLQCESAAVATEAIDFMIVQYLKSNVIIRRSKTEIHATHLALIDRCVEQVIASAQHLRSFADTGAQSDNDEMVVIASEQEIRSEELKFDRSLLFLRSFTNSLKKDPMASPVSTRQDEELPVFEQIQGTTKALSIRVQGNRYMSDAVRTIQVGEDNTAAQLGSYISNITGWTQYTSIHSGKKIDLTKENVSLTELALFAGMPLMVTKTSRTEERVPPGFRAGSPVDTKIMLHFDDLYALLDTDIRLAKGVYDFLRTTSVRDKISQPIKAMATPTPDLLPAEKPYRLLFCTEALKACVEIEYFSKEPDSNFLAYAVAALNHALGKLGAIGFTESLHLSVAFEVLETLSMACRIKVPSSVSQTYFDNFRQPICHLVQFLTFAQKTRELSITQKEPQNLIRVAFEVLLEICLYQKEAWSVLNELPSFNAVLMQCLLHDDRVALRRAFVDVVLALNGSSGVKITFKQSNPHAARFRFDNATVDACLAQIWTKISPAIPLAARNPTQAQELCDTSLIVLKVVGRSTSSGELQRLFNDWKTLLVAHDYHEVVGQPMQDRFISGIAKLLGESARLLKLQDSLPPQKHLSQELVTIFLFPPLSEAHFTSKLSRRPILDPTVRSTLYDLLLVLCQTYEENDSLRSVTSNDFIEKESFRSNVTHERRALRSEVGYAGLRNLSNTCYLNSLLSQLFMHVQFRTLILTSSIVNLDRQKLLFELGKVFAHMQLSQQKYVDPEAAVSSITPYEGGEIDVTVQMDVDEFFNLLFDRLEGQISDNRARAQFKSFYGGETLQQIKSKECEHISERPESFAVLPVEIKGKSRLEDSLKAYVDGEVLQGDNKYSCTSCGRHVDAVKRNCLRQVPDNLIFNLKRFDFDIMTGTRCKLNDLFAFPDELDMAPYTLEYLSSPDEPVSADVFELTGIIVHSGTADSGHYFSYIRQRPSGKDKAHSWVTFNDSDVTPFDPAHIQDYCFGGVDNNCYGLAKFYNAYMLFYQRKTNIESLETEAQHTDPINPLKIDASPELEHHIAQQNELHLREYCVQDENHARFVRDLMGKLWSSRGVQCSEAHETENRALDSTLEYIQQVSSRWKGQPEMDETAKLILSFVRDCPKCAMTTCEWAVEADVAQHSLVQSPYPATRNTFLCIWRTCIEVLHEQAEADLYTAPRYKKVLQKCLQALSDAWDCTFRHPRSWIDYFALLHSILDMGEMEAEEVMRYDFLENCLEVIHRHTAEGAELRNLRREAGKYLSFVVGKEKNRRFEYAPLMDFFAALFVRYDLDQSPRSDIRGLTPTERRLLGLEQVPVPLTWLRKMIVGNHSGPAVNKVVMYLARSSNLAGSLAKMLNNGAEDKHMNVAAAHLEPIAVFCRHAAHENQALDLAKQVLESIPTIDIIYGSEYLRLVQNLLTAQNDVINAPEGFLTEQVVAAMPDWAPVLIVAPNEAQHHVRNESADIVQQLLLRPLEAAREDSPPKSRYLLQVAVQLAQKGPPFVRGAFIGRGKDTTMQPGQMDQFITLMETLVEVLELDSLLTEQKRSEISTILALLRLKSEHAVDPISPDQWQESSDLDASDQEYEDVMSP